MKEQNEYEKIGLRIGLECHQQMTGKKLFCGCPAMIKNDPPDFMFTRQLRASASELGKTDAAAAFEEQKKKYFVYESYHEVNCLVDMDEEPPSDMNKEALQIALQVALLLHAKPVNVVCVMRKVVVDGSNVSGFQRTALIALDGYIETSLGKVSIPTIAVEEESAKKVETTKDYVKYNISRLGIPLVEIATGPDIKSPEHAKETAGLLGMVLRSVKGIKTGLGSIRQDVNLSINGHQRVEIKGFQDLYSIPKVIKFEMERQKQVLQKKEKTDGHVRKAEPDFTTSFLRPMPGAARLYPETDVRPVPLLQNMLDAIVLPKLVAEEVESLGEEHKLSPELAREILKRKINIDQYVRDFPKLEAKYIAFFLVDIPKGLKTRFQLDVSETQLNFMLHLVNEGKILKDFALQALVEYITKGSFDPENYKIISDDEIEQEIKKVVLENKGASINALMGKIMQKYKGKVEVMKVVAFIKKYSG